MGKEFVENLKDADLHSDDALRSAQSGDPGADDPLIGTIMADRLEITGLLGRGGMSSVYKAKHLLLDREVAVKVIQKTDSTAALRFKQEAKAATSLSHPNIAGVREFGVNAQGQPYLVMDYVEGKTLSDLIKENGTLSTERTADLMSQICSGLAHAHKQNIIHRDLKPANVIITTGSDGRDVLKIVDFGIAKIIEDEAQASLTQTGEIFGTPHYMSPEQGQGAPVDARSDVYSLGCMMYECLTGKPPYAGANAIEIILKHTSADIPSLRSLNVVSRLEPVVHCCLSKDPAHRYQSAAELNEDIVATQPKNWSQRRSKEISVGTKKKIAVGVGAAVLFFSVAAFFAVWPVVRPIFFPKPWDKLSMDAAGQSSQGLSNYESAKSLMFKAIDAADKGNAPARDKEMLYQQLGKLYSGSSDWKNSIRFFSKALEFSSAHADDANTGSIHDWMSEAYIYNNQFDQAISHAEKAVDIKRRVLGSGHQYTLLALLHLGQAYRGAHRYADAETVDREALGLAQQLYPSGDNVTLANAYHQLANILADLGKSDEAIANYQKSLDISIVARGSISPQVEKERSRLELYKKNHPPKKL